MDLMQVAGKYPVPKGASSILGVEVSGYIVGLGLGCKRDDLIIGDKVMALLNGGGYAQYATCDERTVIKVTDDIDLKQMAATPEAFMTAYQLTFNLVANTQPGQTLLLHAGSSSIGQAAGKLLYYFISLCIFYLLFY